MSSNWWLKKSICCANTNKIGQQCKSFILRQLDWFADARCHLSALGIATLGREILASLKALYGKDEFFSKAEEAEIFEAKNAILRTVGIRFVSDRCIECQPRVWNQKL